MLELLELLNEVSDLTALAGGPDFAPERPGEVRRSCLDITRARRELSWEPRVPLREGLRTILGPLGSGSSSVPRD